MNMPYRLALLCDAVRKGGPLRWEKNELRGHCPAHNDKSPSLYIRLTEDGHVLLNCKRGCTAEDILKAASLQPGDLFVEKDRWDRVDDDTFQTVKEGVEPDFAAFRPAKPARTPVGNSDTRHEVYHALLEALTLNLDHHDALQARTLKDEEIDRRQYRSLDTFEINQALGQLRNNFGDEALLQVPGFASADGKVVFLQADVKGLLIPVRDLNGRIEGFQVRRDDGDPKYCWISSAGAQGPSPGSPCMFRSASRLPARRCA